jgi:diaminopimelate epimerase
VVGVDDLSNHPVKEQGRDIRYHDRFSPEGTNANFMKVTGPDQLEMRTYERGVEDETLACGTGAIACALVAALRGLANSPVKVRTRGGDELSVHFVRTGDAFDRVWLEGNTAIVYQAQLNQEALLI